MNLIFFAPATKDHPQWPLPDPPQPSKDYIFGLYEAFNQHINWFKHWCPDDYTPYGCEPIPGNDKELFVYAINESGEKCWFTCPKIKINLLI